MNQRFLIGKIWEINTKLTNSSLLDAWLQVGPDGGHISSSVSSSLECNFPRKALTKQISVGLSLMEVEPGHTLELTQQGGAVAPVITVEPRRRKFHKPITVSVPLPPLPSNTSAIETSLLVGQHSTLLSHS